MEYNGKQLNFSGLILEKYKVLLAYKEGKTCKCGKVSLPC